MKTKIKLLMTMFLAALLISLMFAPASHAALQAVGPVDPANGFPSWYQDTNGLALAPCFDTNGFCPITMATGPGFDPGLPLVFPTNFPEEGFYFIGEAFTTTNDFFYRAALEFAFANLVQNGDQMVFARIRHRNVAAPDGTYTITHPYGVDTVVAAGGGVNFTEDVGIAPLVFDGALAGRIGPFLAPVAGLVTSPDGNVYIGNGIVEAAVTGSPFGTNTLTVAGPIGGTATRFALEGKVIGLTTSPASVAFQPTAPGVVRASPTITVSPISATTFGTLASSNTANFTIASNTCVGTITPPATCSFVVNFTEAAPGVNGAKTGTITIPITAPANMPSGTVAVSGEIDAVAPTVTLTAPADGTKIPANSKFFAVFSEAMDPATINATTFTLTSGGAAVTAQSVAYDAASKTATFVPSAQLLPVGVGNTATITTGATDVAGNPLAATAWSFTTVAADNVAPTIASVSPANSAIGVRINSPITITFDDKTDDPTVAGEMNPLSINDATFTVSGGVTGSLTFDPATKTATFTPSVNLTPGTLYTVTVKGGAAGVDDWAANKLAADFSFAFRANSNPTVPALISPADSATGIGSSVVMRWAKAEDDEGDTIAYHVEVCTNRFFTGADCVHQDVPVTASAPRLNGAYLAGLGGLGFAVIGLVSLSGTKGRKRLIMLMLAATLISGAVISACGKKTETVTQTVDPGTGVSFTATGLAPGTRYFWRVESHDPNGGASFTDTRTFTTQ